MKIYEFHDFLFYRINEKTPESLNYTGLSGVISGVPGAIRTHGLPLRRRMLYPAELRRRI